MGSPDGGVISPELETLSGTWDYQIMNAYDARFVDCSGDAAVLEGKSFYEGFAVAPICTVPNSFDVVQDGAALEFMPGNVDCSGSTAAVSGHGVVAENSLGGSWEVASADGVVAVHAFAGTMDGNVLAIRESGRSFAGSFQGACELQPPLEAAVTIR